MLAMILAAIEGILGIGACVGAGIAVIGAGLGIGKIGASAMCCPLRCDCLYPLAVPLINSRQKWNCSSLTSV